MPITGYGKGWQEPLATTRWGRFRQRMRAPMTKTDVWIGLGLLPLLTVFGALVVRLLAV